MVQPGGKKKFILTLLPEMKNYKMCEFFTIENTERITGKKYFCFRTN